MADPGVIKAEARTDRPPWIYIVHDTEPVEEGYMPVMTLPEVLDLRPAPHGIKQVREGNSLLIT